MLHSFALVWYPGSQGGKEKRGYDANDMYTQMRSYCQVHVDYKINMDLPLNRKIRRACWITDNNFFTVWLAELMSQLIFPQYIYLECVCPHYLQGLTYCMGS